LREEKKEEKKSIIPKRERKRKKIPIHVRVNVKETLTLLTILEQQFVIRSRRCVEKYQFAAALQHTRIVFLHEDRLYI
jgi:hypothetical protein